MVLIALHISWKEGRKKLWGLVGEGWKWRVEFHGWRKMRQQLCSLYNRWMSALNEPIENSKHSQTVHRHLRKKCWCWLCWCCLLLHPLPNSLTTPPPFFFYIFFFFIKQAAVSLGKQTLGQRLGVQHSMAPTVSAVLAISEGGSRQSNLSKEQNDLDRSHLSLKALIFIKQDQRSDRNLSEEKRKETRHTDI